MKIEKNEVDSNVVFAQVGVTFHFHITSKTRGVRGSRGKNPFSKTCLQKKTH